MKNMKYAFFVVGLLLVVSVAEAAPRIVDVALSTNVVNRQPAGVFNPPGSCSTLNNPPSNIPIMDSSVHRKVFLWTKVSASESFVLLHAYFKDGVAYQVKRTITPWIDKVLQYIEDIKVGIGWKNIANVELNVRQSDGWRTWSSKEIDPVVHKGSWRVQVSPTNNANEIICVVYFKVL